MKSKIKKLVPILLSVVMCGSMFAAGCNTTINNTVNGDQNFDTDLGDVNVGGNTGSGSGSTEGGNTGESGSGSTEGGNTGESGSGSTEGGNTGESGSGSTEGGNTGESGSGSTEGGNTGESGSGSTEGGNTGSDTTTSTPLSADNKIYVVGDSTVCSFNDGYYLPRYGYGTQLAEYLNVTSDQIVNLALSGRSSKSFLTESNYTTLKDSISEGDYLIIGFGHNDEKSDDKDRFTSPVGDKDKAGSFQNSLYVNYVKMALDKGATPILCTPITRYDSSSAYTGSKVHVTSDGDYAQAIKDLGAATDTTVIDLTALTIAEYKKDNAQAVYYHAHTSYAEDPVATVTGNETPSGRDDTHINKFGAKMVSYQFANALKETDCALKAHVKDGITAPTKAADYAGAVNKSYVKPDYKPFDPANTTATKLTGDWYATAMGKCGGSTKLSSLTAKYENETFTVGDTGNAKGSKFESGADGFGAAFMQIDISKNFTASATVTVKSVDSGLTNSQGGFGMMLRDDILIDTNDDTLASNYVAAGLLNKKAPVFSRENGTLNSSGSSSGIVKGETHTISIKRVGQTVVVKFDDTEKTFTDFDFVARDNNYMYLCLFANRGIVAEFTDVKFEITGESQGA